MTALQIDIESAAGARLGDGPLVAATRWQYTRKLDRAGRVSLAHPTAHPRANLLQTGRIARAYDLVGDDRAELGAAIIDQIAVKVGRPSMLAVEGDDLLRELTYTDVGELEIADLQTVRPANFQQVIDLGGGTTELTDAYDGSTGTSVNVTLLTAPSRFLYVGSPVKFDRVTLTLGASVNNNLATLIGEYFDGDEWDGLTLTDGTAVGGATLGQSGTVSWTAPDDWLQMEHDNKLQYWVRFKLDADPDAVQIQEVTIRTTGPTTDGISLIMALAPAGWSIDTSDWYGTTAKGAYFKLAGETVLGALVKLAEHCGEHFRLGVGRQIQWLRTDQPSSGVRAIGPVADPDAIQANHDVCLITLLEELEDATEEFNRIYPYGAGNAEGRVTLAACTESAPAGYTVNAASNYIEKTTVTTRITRRVNFPDIAPLDETALNDPSAANQLFRAALHRLQQHDGTTSFKSYRLTVASCDRVLLPGETIRALYREVIDDYVAVDIDAELVILEATTAVDQQGVRTVSLVAATLPRWPQSDVDLLTRAVRDQVMGKAHHQPVASKAIQAQLTGPMVKAALFGAVGGEAQVLGNVLTNDLKPDGNNTRDLGDASHYFAEGYITALNAVSGAFSGAVSVGGDLSLAGLISESTYYRRKLIVKTGIPDNSATAFCSITTANESGVNDGGGYICRVTAFVGHAIASTTGNGAVKPMGWVFARSMENNGTGVSGTVTTIFTGSSAANTSGTRDIGTVTLSLSESSEYVQHLSIQVDLTGSSVAASQVVALVEVFHYGFLTAPVIAAL